MQTFIIRSSENESDYQDNWADGIQNLQEPKISNLISPFQILIVYSKFISNQVSIIGKFPVQTQQFWSCVVFSHPKIQNDIKHYQGSPEGARPKHSARSLNSVKNNCKSFKEKMKQNSGLVDPGLEARLTEAYLSDWYHRVALRSICH